MTTITDDGSQERRREFFDMLDGAGAHPERALIGRAGEGDENRLDFRRAPPASRVPARLMNDEQTYLAFVWTPAGYELREEHGELPSVGSTVESDGKRWTVSRSDRRRCPSDSRICAYLQG